jgi:PAS domain S-box-containing protein
LNTSGHAIDPQIFTGLFEAYPDGVLLVDPQGCIVLANQAAAEVLGYRAGALVGLSVDALVPDNVALRHAGYRRGYAQAPTSRPMGTDLELMAKRVDGSEVMVEIALSPLRVGEVDYVVASLRGIGTYPRVKRALLRAHYNEFLVRLGRVAVDTRQPEELLKSLPAMVREALEVQAVSVFMLTPNRHELHSVSYSGVHVDQVHHLVYANRPDTLLGHVVAQSAPVLVDNTSSEQRFEVPARLLEAGARSCVGVPINDRGLVVGVLAAWSNQSRKFGEDEVVFLQALATLLSTSLQRAQAEAQARHAQRLETVGQLTGGVAHDFNNLLTVILGNLQFLQDQPAVQGDALLQQLAAAAARAGRRGADLTGKLLAFARRQTLAPTAVDPIAMLHSMADMLRRTLGENIRVTVQTPRTCPRCLADVTQLESALLNVAVNARDAMPDGGSLVLRCGTGRPTDVEGARTRPATLEAGAAGANAAPDQVWISVQDDGSGMTPDVLDRAFEPFFTTKEPGRGTGLGLSTVYGFINQSRGHIDLDSAPGAGTTLTMYLPAVDAGSETSGNRARHHEKVPRGLRVLVVEDNVDVRHVAQTFLRSMGCEVAAFDNAESALAALAGGERGAGFDLLFSDITLGAGVDGHELARRVDLAYPAVRVLLTSGYSHHVAGGGRAGVPLRWPVLAKPYTRQDLAHAIAQCLPRGSGRVVDLD